VLGTSALAQVGASGRAAPGLVGLSKADATTAAKQAGFSLRVSHRASSDPSGVILQQDPAPGVWLYGGGGIGVVVSSGPSKIRTPLVKGLSGPDAIAALKHAGLLTKTSHGFSQTTRVGVVFAQDPPADQSILPGSTVRITWSDGPPPMPVPDVHGFLCAAAIAQLETVHLVGTCTKVYHDTVPVDIVIGTVPPALTVHPQNGTPITILVSKGPQLVEVPDVIGKRVADATKQLKDLGFVVVVPNYNPKGHVFEQSPAPRTKIKKGSTVTLIL
jgi:serine/threonine-protein kinase